jgi:thiol-disulfide isomerase/thioredoxin
MITRSSAALLLLLVGCATATPRIEGDPVVLSIQNLACSDCAGEIEAEAMRVTGVRSASFDTKASELHLVVAPHVAPDPIVRVLEGKPVDGRPIHVVVGAGQGAYAPFEALDPSLDAEQISAHGEDVADLLPAAKLGKVTVFDFSAAWCGPCHEVDAHMRDLVARDPRVAYRRINVETWDSPVAKHYLQKVQGLPFVIVLDLEGHEVARISGLAIDKLDAAIARGKATKP